jgi:hypothetical protein
LFVFFCERFFLDKLRYIPSNRQHVGSAFIPTSENQRPSLETTETQVPNTGDSASGSAEEQRVISAARP